MGRVRGHGAPVAAIKQALTVYAGGLGFPQGGLTLRLVGERACRGLNRVHRGVDAATDILSFPSVEGPRLPGKASYLGDLAFCPPYAWRRRGRFFRDFGAETAFLLLHGLLHLTGRHHDTTRQERALERVSGRLHPLGRPWFADLRALGPKLGTA